MLVVITVEVLFEWMDKKWEYAIKSVRVSLQM